jgi:hypothetical protein
MPATTTIPIFLVGLSLAIAALPVNAGPVPSLNIDSLIASSDAIVVAEVLTVAKQGTVEREYSGRRLVVDTYQAKVRCLRVLKSEIKPGDTILVEFVSSDKVPLPSPVLRERQTAMMFLSEVPKEKVYQFSHQYHAIQPAYTKEAAVDVRLAVSQRVESEFIVAIGDPDEMVALAALDRLCTMDSQMLRKGQAALLEKVTGRVRSALELTLLALRVRDEPGKALAEVGKQLAFGSDKDGWSSAEYQVLSALRGVKDERALPAMYELLNHTNRQIRRAVIWSIRDLADRTAIPYLVKGLQDADHEVSYGCLVALCRITRRSGPGMGDFLKDKQKYLTDWDRWWGEQNKASGAKQ